MRKVLAVLVLAAGSTLWLTAGAQAGTDESHAGAGQGDLLWASRYRDPAAKSKSVSYLANAVAVSPRGQAVFVTGSAPGSRSSVYATVGYNAVTGAQLWARRYDGPANRINVSSAVAVSPSGKTVFVTGTSDGRRGTGSGYATIAYAAATGKRLWISRYDGPVRGNDDAYALAVSPDGGTVFVTGQSAGIGTGEDYATVAYNARTGARRWVRRYSGPGKGPDSASAIAVSPDGSTVIVTGTSAVSASRLDYATVAYDAKTGSRLWVSRYGGLSSSTDSEAASLAVSKSGTVFVTGQSDGSRSASSDYATVAYDGATGTQLWVQRFGTRSINLATDIAVVPSGSTVFVSGLVMSAQGAISEYATIAYSAATGARKWVRRAVGYGTGGAVAVSPTGAAVYMTGIASPGFFATVAYSASTGRTLWHRRYEPRSNANEAAAMAVSPVSGAVYVTGTTFAHYVTVAYSG